MRNNTNDISFLTKSYQTSQLHTVSKRNTRSFPKSPKTPLTHVPLSPWDISRPKATFPPHHACAVMPCVIRAAALPAGTAICLFTCKCSGGTEGITFHQHLMYPVKSEWLIPISSVNPCLQSASREPEP